MIHEIIRPETQLTPAISAIKWQTSRRPTAVSVRRATDADAAVMAHISRHGFADAHATAFQSRSDLELYLSDSFTKTQIQSEISAGDNIFLVAESDAEVVGTVRLSQAPPPQRIPLTAAVELGRLYMRPAYIGQGIGSALMLRAMETAQDTGFHQCWLAVWEGNERAIQFYRQWDFRVVGTVSLPVGQSCPYGLVMARSL